MSNSFYLFRDEDLIIIDRFLEGLVLKVLKKYDTYSDYCYEEILEFLNEATGYDPSNPTKTLNYDKRNAMTSPCYELLKVSRRYPLNRTEQNLHKYYNHCLDNRIESPKSRFKVSVNDLSGQFDDYSVVSSIPNKPFKKNRADLIAKVISRYLNERAKDEKCFIQIEEFLSYKTLTGCVENYIMNCQDRETYQQIVSRLYRDFEISQCLFYTFRFIEGNGEMFDNYVSFKKGKHTDKVTDIEPEEEFLKLFLEFSTGKVDETLLCIRTYIEEQLFENERI